MRSATLDVSTSPQVRSVWADLLALLWLAQVACSTASAKHQLQLMGYRRAKTACRILADEQKQVLQLALKLNVCPSETERARRIGEMAREATFPECLRRICQAYRELKALHADRPGLAEWCDGRLRIHGAQMQYMEFPATYLPDGNVQEISHGA
ncbi:hypothetical protein [Roseateles sp.]|uniref:hypothetical protein n=1 Tax=Roseateles sp. TaxID=1971397 RepID=UPI003D13FF78